jgi:hypothetical protein
MLPQSLRFPVAAVRHSPGVTALSRDPYLFVFLTLWFVDTITSHRWETDHRLFLQVNLIRFTPLMKR